MAQTATTPQASFDALPMIRELAYLETPGWGARLDRLRRSGVPLNEGGDDAAGEPAAGAGAGEGSPAEPAAGAGEPAGEPAAEPAAGGEPETFDREYVESLRKENAKYRTRAKELEEADQKRKDDELSELERERKQREQAEEKAARLERDALRRKVLDEHKLDADMAEFLTGDDEDAMTEQAKKLAAKVTVRKPTLNVPGGPQGGGNDSAISADEAVRLAKEDPAKFNELFDKGEIPASALGGK